MNTKTEQPASSARTPEIFGGIDSPFKLAVTLGQGLASEKDGKPVKHYWKQALLPKTFLDANGVVHKVDEQRIDTVVSDFKKAVGKGHRAPILNRHVKKGEYIDPAWSRGFLLDARKDETGGVEYFCEVIGQDAIDEAERNQASICIYPDEIDEDGDRYQQFTHHLAICPDPQLRNLKPFTPALAASQRGATATPVYLMLASSLTGDSEMELIAQFREALGAGKDIPDSELPNLVKSLKSDKDKAITLSQTAEQNFNTKLGEANGKITTLEQRVAQLSKTPDPDILADRADLMNGKIDLCLSQGKCSKAQADLMRGMLKEGDKPNALMLSRTGATGTPIDAMLKVLELNANLTGSVTGLQFAPDPNKDGDTLAESGAAVASAFAQQQLAQRGLK